MSTQLQRLFDVRPAERHRVGWMMLYSLAAIGGVVIAGRVISRTLFLSMLPQSAAPFKYILPPLFVVAALTLYTRITPRMPSHRLIIGSSLFMIAGVLGFRLVLETPLANHFGVVAALFVYFEVIATLVGVQFWTFAAETFTTREARRLFGVITLGGLLANSLSGGALHLAAAQILPRDLLFLVAAGLLGSAVAVGAVARHPVPDPLVPPQAAVAPPLRGHWANLWSTPLLVTVGAMMIVASLAANIVEYQMDLSLLRFFGGDGQAMLAFLGRLQFWFGLAALLVQLLITNQVMKRFGLLAGLLILPLLLASGATVVLVTGGILASVVIGRGANVALRYTVNDVTTNMLFLPIPANLRRQAKALLDGVVKPPVVGLLGLLFLFSMNPNIDLEGVQAADVVPWSYVVVALAVGWVILAFRAHRQYAEALAHSLHARRLDLDTSLNLSDAQALRVLQATLADADPARVVHALDLIAGARPSGLLPHVTPLLAHPLPAVRVAAVRAVGALGDAGQRTALAALLSAAQPEVAAAAVAALCLLQGSAATPLLLPLLAHPAVPVRAAALVGLIRHGGVDGARQGAAHLQGLLDAADPAARAAGAAVVGELGMTEYSAPLLALLDDADVEVQRAAIRAAGGLRHPDLIPRLVHKLDQPRVAQLARRSLRGFGPGAEAQLTAWLADADLTRATRLCLVSVLEEIATPAATAALLDRVDDADRRVRGAVLAALARRQQAGAPVAAERTWLQQAARRELHDYYVSLVIEADLRDTTGQTDLLVQALQGRRARILARLFALLQLLHPDRDLSQVQRVLATGSTTVQANAVELVSVVVAAEVGDLLLPLLEADAEQWLRVATQTLGVPRRSADDRLLELVLDRDPWIAACSLHAIGAAKSPALAAAVETGLTAREPLVREAALWACGQMLPPAAIRRVAQRLLDDPHPLPRRYAAHLLQVTA